MSLSLGELLLQLRIDPTVYHQQLERARLAALRSGTEIERSLNLSTPKFSADGYATVHRDLDLVGKHWTQTGNLMQAKPLTPTVDDRALTDLNKHIDEKQAHWTEAGNQFSQNALTPKVDDRALTALNQKLDQLSGKSVGVSVTASGNTPNAAAEKIKPQIDASGIEGSVTGAIESGFKKVKPSSGSAIGGLISAPFKLVKGMLGTVFEGAGLQIGGSIAKDLGDGLSDGIQAELSHLIGSFRLVGKTLGQGLSEDLINSMGSDLQGIEGVLNDIIGKTNIEVEGFATRGQQTAKDDKRRGFAGEQARAENKAFKQNFDRLKQTEAELQKQRDAIQAAMDAYQGKFEGEVDRLGGGSKKEQMESNQQQREALYGQIKQATDSGDTQTANALQGQMKTLADSYSELSRQLREIYQVAESNLGEDSAALQQQVDRFYVGNRAFQKEVAVSRNQDLLRIPANVAAKSGRVVQDAGVRGTQQHQTVAGFYEQVVAEVAKRSNLAMPSPEMIPKLVANAELPKDAQASYRAGLNEIHVRPETIEGIAKGDLGDDEFETLIHELRHAMQAMFGELAGTSEVAVDLLKATGEEAREVGRRIEASVGANTGGSASYNRAIEEDAYIFAKRNKGSIGQAVSGKQAQARFVDSVGIGGGGLENKYNLDRLNLLKIMSGQAQKAGQKVDVSDENKAMFAGIAAIDETFKQSLADIPNIADLSPAEIDAELTGLEDSYKAAMAELKSLTTDFIEAVMKKPEEVVAVARETMGTFNRKQDLIPIAQKAGIADADKLSKPQLIDAIAASPDTRSMTDEVFARSRARAAKIQARRDAIDDAKARAAEAAYGAGVTARKVVGAGQAVMQSPVGQGARRAIGAVGQAAQLGYGIAQGVEKVALDFVPGGRMMKGVGQQFVLPAAMFGAATHMVPGGQAMAHGLQGMAQGALSPMASNAAHMLGGEAGQTVANMLPDILGLKAQVMAAVSGGVEQLMTGAATAAIDAAVAIGGGKVIQNAVSKPVQAIAGKPQLALPPARAPFQIAAAQKQRDKVLEVVEAVPKKFEATATIGQTTRNPSPFGGKAPAQKTEAVASATEFKFELMPAADVIAMVEERKNKIEMQFKQINAQFKASIGDGNSVNDAQIATFSSTFRNIIDQGRKDLDQLLETVRNSGASSPELIAKIGGLKGRLTQKEQGIDKKLRRLKSQQPSGSIDVEASPVEERYAVSGKAAQAEIDRVMRSFAPKLKQMLPDIAAIAGGTVAGVAAGGSGHVAGGVAGVMGSMAGRGAAIAGQSANDAYAKLRDSEQFKAGTLLQKFNAILTETSANMQAMQSSMGDGLTGDMTGAAIAAAIDQILDAVSPSLAAIPGKGAAAATILTPAAVEVRKRFASDDQAAYAFEDLSKQIDAVLADFGGLGEESDQVAYAFRDLGAIVEEMQARFDKVNPNGEVEAAQAEAGGHRAAFKFERAEQNINRRYDQSLKTPDSEGPETLTSRMKRVMAASGSMDGIRGKIGGVIGTVAKLPGVMSLALTSFLGFNAIAVLGPLFASITNGASEAALEMERFTRVINFTSGGSAKGAENLAQLRSEANRLGLDLKSSIAGYAQFSASTKDTPIEGDQTMSVFKNVSQASANYGLQPQAQERVFTAMSQMASKGVVSMEELRQQLGESLPGALNTAARSMGMTTKEFSKMVERGEVLSSDFLPKFAMQLGAESSTGVNGAAKSAQASFNRLNNTIFELQVTIGKGLLSAQKIGADVAVVGIQKLVGVLELLLKILPTVSLMFAGKFVVGLMAGKAVIPFILKLLADIGPTLLKLLPTIVTFMAKFLIIQTIVDVMMMVGKAMSDQGGKFREFADSASSSLKDYESALASARKAQDGFTMTMPKDAKDVKGESLLEDTLVGKAAGLLFGKGGVDFVRGAEQNVQKALGMKTFAEKQAEDRSMAMDELVASRSKAHLAIAQQRKNSGSELNQVREIDKDLESVQGRRRALAVTNPNDKDGMRDLKKQEDDLLARREQLGKPVAALQQANAAEIETYKAAIKELNQLAQDGKITQGDYEKNIYAMNSALEAAQKDQDELNKAIKTSVNSLESFERAWASIINRLEDANFALKRTGDESRKAIALAELGGGTQGSSNRSSEILQQEQLRLKIEATRAAIAQMRAELDVQDVATVQANFNINDQTGPNDIKDKADRAATGSKEKSILERLSQLKTMEGEVIGFDADLAEAQVAAKRRLIDLTKQVQEFYRGIERQAQESALDAKNISREITGNNAKAKLKGALKGFQDNYVSEFVDSLVGLIDSLNEPFKIAIEANKQMLGKQNQLADVMRQSQEMMNQLPNGYEGMGAGGAGVPTGAPTALIGAPVGKGVDTSSMNLWSTGGGSEMISSSNQLRRHHNMNGNYNAKSDATYNSLGQVVLDLTFEDKASKSVNVPIPAPVSGTVVEAGLKGGYGNAVLIKEAKTGEEVLLGHLKSISVKAGQQITEGMEVGIQGGTGKGGVKRFDEHLHLEASKAIGKRYVDNVIQGKYKGVVGRQEEHHEGDGHDHGQIAPKPSYQGGQKHVVIPLDHTRVRIPDKTGGNTYSGSGQTGAAYKGYTERDFQDMLAVKAKAQLEAQGFKVTVLKPESFKSFEQYDDVIAKLSKQAGTTVTPLHYDARMSGYSGGYLTRSRAGDAADDQLSDAIFRNMKAQAGSGASSKFVGKDTESNATIKAAAAAPATLVEFGAMADLVDRYGSVDKYSQSQEFKKALGGYVSGVSQFYGGGRPQQAPQQQRSPQATNSANGQMTYAQVEQMMRGGGNSQIAKLVGMAEGNRRVDGSYTEAASGHVDKGNHKANIGSFSAQGDFNRGSVEASDQAVIDELLRPNLKRLFDRASQLGVAVTPKLMMNYIDTLNQGGEAVGTGWSDSKSTGKGFLGKLEMVKGRENDDAAIKQLRMESYRNTSGRREVSAIFSDPQRMSEDQERRMGHINKAMSAFKIAPVIGKTPPPGVMMPTTGMNQGQVQQYEFQAKEFNALRGQVDQATALAQGTTNAEIEQIKKLTESQITLKQAENLQAIRKAKRQLIVGGREQERGNRTLPEQLEDIEKSLGDDTALKSLKNDISGKKREARDYKERLSDSIEKTQSSLVDAESMIELIQSGGMPEQFNQFLPELKKQRDSIAKQLTGLRATDAKVDKTFGKAIADIQRKYNLDLLGRQFESGQSLSGAQIKSARAEAEKIRADIEQPFTTPEAKKVGQFRSAKLDRYAGLSEVRNEEASRKEELRKLAIAQPDIYNPERIAAETKFLEEASKRKMGAIESQYQKAIKDIDHDLVTKELERSREGIKRSIEQLREQARDLQVQGKDEKLLASDPIKALGLQQQSYEKSYEADLQAMQVEVEEFNQQQDELVRSSQRTRDAAEQAKKQFQELNQVKLGNLKSELAQNTAELERQRQEIQYQSKARLFDINQQFGAEQIKKFREFDGNGIGAIDLQQTLDLGKLEFDLTAKLRDLDLDKTITPEAKAQIRDRLKSIAEMQGNSITINADLAREDNEFQSKTLLFNAAMQANSAKGNYARTLGFESQARDADKAGAIAQEQYNLADGLRKIDEQARSLGLAPEVVEQLKTNLESLNQVNLKNINAQFNPMIDALKAVKGAFQGFMGDIISGNETIGDAFNKMVDNILQSLSALAAQLITEQLFGSLFGLGKGGGGEKGGKGGGGIGGIFASIFGMADGGVVPSIGQGNMRDRPDAVGAALRKEGPNSVLAALTPGERVLSRIETQRFYGLGLNRWVERPSTTLARVASSERAQKVYNFATGGVVPGAVPITPGAAGGLGNTVNVPIEINGGGGQTPGINVSKMRDAIRAEVLEELRRQRRPRSEFG